MSLRLYDLAGAQPERRFSPYCWRVRLALAHKNLPVETIPWRFTEKAEIAASGQTLVPVLVDGDRWIADSWTKPTRAGRCYGPSMTTAVSPAAIPTALPYGGCLRMCEQVRST